MRAFSSKLVGVEPVAVLESHRNRMSAELFQRERPSGKRPVARPACRERPRRLAERPRRSAPWPTGSALRQQLRRKGEVERIGQHQFRCLAFIVGWRLVEGIGA